VAAPAAGPTPAEDASAGGTTLGNCLTPFSLRRSHFRVVGGIIAQQGAIGQGSVNFIGNFAV